MTKRKNILTKLFPTLFLNPREKEFRVRLRKLLGYTPADYYLYHLAFTHKSVRDVRKLTIEKTNERLEFLGDAVLSLAMANILFEMYPKADEGFMSDMRARVVSREFFNNLGKDLGLEFFIRNEIPSYKEVEIVESILGNGFEALFGAIFLDEGFLTAQTYLNKVIKDRKINLEEIRGNNKNYKSRLLEWSQKEAKSIEYEVLDTFKESNNIIFEIAVKIDGKILGKGKGTKKKKAEQEASYEALKGLKLVD